MKCPHCHKKLSKGLTACPYCNGELPPPKNGSNSPSPNPWRKPVAILLAAAILFGGVGVLGWQLGWFDWMGNLFAEPQAVEELVPKNLVNAEMKEDVICFSAEDTDAIEQSILATTQDGDNLLLEMNSSSPLSELNEGDIFALQGFTDSAFGESYFGKIIFKYDNGEDLLVGIQTPALYELFDDLEMDILQYLDYTTIADFQAVDGVTLCEPEAALKAEDDGMQIETLSAGSGVTVEDGDKQKGIGLKLDIDLLKLLQEYGKSESDKSIFREATKEEAKHVTVYATDTGMCYHNDGCYYLSRSKNEMTLYEAAEADLRPCSVCTPYYINDPEHKFASVEKELKLTGVVRLTNLSFGVVGKNGKKWELEQGFENLSVQTGGTLYANAKLTGNCKLKFEGETTSITVDGWGKNPFLTIEGLKEKMLPFAYCTWNGATFQVTGAPDDDAAWNAPVSIGILFYTDLYGEISFGFELNCEYTKPISKSFDIYKNGKFLGIGAEKEKVTADAQEENSNGKLTWSVKAELAGDITFEALGASVMLYVGNVNLLELSVATLAANVKGAVGFDSTKLDNDSYGFYAEGDARIYLEMFKLKIKASVEGLGGILDLEADCTLGPMINLNIWQLNKQTERDIVLVLDASGSMDGTPIAEAKNATEKFVNTMMGGKEDVSVSIVTYENRANTLAPLTSHQDTLLQAIDQIYAGGGTNIDAGLSQAEALLNARNAKKKSIVLLSDGLPNDGRCGSELTEYAQALKDQGIYIYTLGFFTSLSGEEKNEAVQLMKELASPNMDYEVSSADDLVFFFGDLADQLSGQNYIYVRIACPVDVTVKYKGQTLCSKDGKENTRTDFGTLTFEENDEEAEDEDSDNRIKILRLKEGVEYDIQIEGNGRGRMDYTIGFVDEEGEYSDMREFRNIKITRKTEIKTVATRSDSTYLYVDQDGDGKTDLTYMAKMDSRAQLVEEPNIALIAAIITLSLLVAGGITAGVILAVRKKKAKKAQTTA